MLHGISLKVQKRKIVFEKRIAPINAYYTAINNNPT